MVHCPPAYEEKCWKTLFPGLDTHTHTFTFLLDIFCCPFNDTCKQQHMFLLGLCRRKHRSFLPRKSISSGHPVMRFQAMPTLIGSNLRWWFRWGVYPDLFATLLHILLSFQLIGLEGPNWNPFRTPGHLDHELQQHGPAAATGGAAGTQ